MIITGRSQPPSPSSAAGGGLRVTRGLGGAVLGASFTAIGVIAIVLMNPKDRLTYWMDDHGYVVTLGYDRTAEAARVPVAWLASRFSRDRVPGIQLDIKFKHLQQLRALRADALAKGILIQSEDDYVPATIRYDERSVRVKLRLKGDLTDAIERGAWSFRVRVSNGDHVFGMRRFSIHHPRVRGYQGEPLFLEAMRREGLLAPRYFFIDVNLNGDFIGRMALEEHFSKELLESQGRRESVIVKFDESALWNARLRGDSTTRYEYYTATVVPFRASTVAESVVLTQDLRVATGLLRSFIGGDLPAREVFDPRLMGRFLAVAEAWGAWHALLWHNMRFYYNPLIARLEPVAFDGMISDPRTSDQLVTGRYPIVRALLADSAVGRHYEATLVRLAEADSSFDRLQLVHAQYLSVLIRHYPLVRPLDLPRISQRAQRLLNLWRGVESVSPDTDRARLRAHVIQGPAGPYLELTNLGARPIEVLGVERRLGDSITTPVRLTQDSPIVLAVSASGDGPTMVVPMHRDAPSVGGRLFVVVRTRGESETVAVPAEPYYAAIATSPIPESTLAAILREHPFLDRTGESWLTVEPGTWDIGAPLALPEGMGLRLHGGTTLRFAAHASLVVRGPVEFRGRRDSPIILDGWPTSGGGSSWQGLAVLGAQAPSFLSHVEVRHTFGINHQGWQLTGGVTFYESEIHIDNTRFVGNRAEDALNLVRSTFALSDVDFTDAASDALDVDFSQGSITGGTFRNIGWVGGGDAVDISGSRVTLTGTRFDGIGDKAISVGEGSDVLARNVWVESAGAGAVSKDGSRLQIVGGGLKNILHSALMAYIKKPEYGPATLEASGVEIEQVGRETWVQTGSVVVIDGRRVRTEAVNVDSLYNTAMRKGVRQ